MRHICSENPFQLSHCDIEGTMILQDSFKAFCKYDTTEFYHITSKYLSNPTSDRM
ncbi:hypothetical protein Mal35_33710 [Gimesia maris]|nr:hypothetical protein Mal35_33710 [Gimesia maris]